MVFFSVETLKINFSGAEWPRSSWWVSLERSRCPLSNEPNQDVGGLERDCPLCHRGYSQLSQHLGVSHGVRNKAERKLLLAIPSRRVDVRKGTCPLPACGKYTSRMDRHLATHTEIMVAARRQATETLKRKKILEGLTQLRASNPAVAMVSTLDLAGDLEDPIVADAAEEQESACNNPSCQDEWEDLRRPVDMLSESLRKVTRRYRLLLRRSRGKPSSQLARVTGRLLSSLRLLAPGEAEEEEDQPLALPLEEADRQDPGPEAPAPQPPQCFYFSLSLRLPLSLSLHGSPSYAARLSLFPQISTHKTNQAFGAAQLALSGEEYGWLTDFLDMRPYLVGGETAHYFFFTSKPSSCKNLNQYFQEAWAGMGLPGSPTFMDIRTSIATHVSVPPRLSASF
ncbi:hypothetical protein ABG768_018665 [Culter alburnus]|uniref:C2H2-type domain-containing protein n=1 Tax=Culter alburnus TaxID=194366 RepID=A0AAW2ATL3_CULAL